MDVIVRPSALSGKKWTAFLPDGRRVHFGAAGYSDFTMHKDVARRERYVVRHRRRENWTRAGIHTPGFWSRWLLWNKPSLSASASDLRRRFDVRVRFRR